MVGGWLDQVGIRLSQLSTKLKLKLKLKLSLAIKNIKERAFGKLERDKSNHSKVMNMKYKELKMQSYFLLILPPEGRCAGVAS